MNHLLHLTLQNASSIPIFRQIQGHIEKLISDGRIKEGERLPSERELAHQLGVSRGTVKKAYENLINAGVLFAHTGKGSFVRGVPQTESRSRLERAMAEVDRTIFTLEKLHFTHHQIDNLFSSRLEQRKHRLASFSVAAVECNPEALTVYLEQLSSLSYCSYKEILLPNLLKSADPASILESYDLIIVTHTHYPELSALVPGLEERIVQVSVAPTPKTLVSLGTISAEHRVGILHHSERFLHIARQWIGRFHTTVKTEGFISSERGALQEFLKDKEILVVPPSSSMGLSGQHLEDIRDFRQRGGRIIYFEYHIEEGSLKHLERVFTSLL